MSLNIDALQKTFPGIPISVDGPCEDDIKINIHNIEGRQKAFEAFYKKQSDILIGKGHDYTAGKAETDSLANFRIIGNLLDKSPYEICLVYFLKHVFSVITFSKSGRQESGEGLEGRHLDIANYAFILNELVPDHLLYIQGKANDK